MQQFWNLNTSIYNRVLCVPPPKSLPRSCQTLWPIASWDLPSCYLEGGFIFWIKQERRINAWKSQQGPVQESLNIVKLKFWCPVGMTEYNHSRAEEWWRPPASRWLGNHPSFPETWLLQDLQISDSEILETLSLLPLPWPDSKQPNDEQQNSVCSKSHSVFLPGPRFYLLAKNKFSLDLQSNKLEGPSGQSKGG